MVEMLTQQEYYHRRHTMKKKKFDVLSDGHIVLIDVMGGDQDIVDAARISYGKGTKKVSEDKHLIRYLMRHKHSTPSEMVVFKFRLRVPMDTWRQIVRHRMVSINEYSTRYSEAISETDTTDSDEWRLQSNINKQGSGEHLKEWPEDFTGVNTKIMTDNTPGEWLSAREKELQLHAQQVYQERLKLGVAREQARKDLPLSTYTEAYWKIDLHNLLHFLSLRMDAHAQLEIRQYANIIGHDIVAQLCPVTWEAFLDYRLEAMFLTRMDVETIRNLVHNMDPTPNSERLSQCLPKAWHKMKRCRERDECFKKLERLGIID